MATHGHAFSQTAWLAPTYPGAAWGSIFEHALETSFRLEVAADRHVYTALRTARHGVQMQEWAGKLDEIEKRQCGPSWRGAVRVE